MFAVSAATGLTVWGNTKPQARTQSLSSIWKVAVFPLSGPVQGKCSFNTDSTRVVCAAVLLVHVTADGGSRPLITATPTALTSQPPAEKAL